MLVEWADPRTIDLGLRGALPIGFPRGRQLNRLATHVDA